MTSQRVDLTPQMIEDDIARQREQLANTVHDLQVRLKTRARQGASLVAAGAGLVAAVLVALKVRRRRG